MPKAAQRHGERGKGEKSEPAKPRDRSLPKITGEQILQRGTPVKVPEAAAALTFSLPSMYRAIDRGEIPAIRVGHAIRLPLRWFRQTYLALLTTGEGGG
jgi:excisionase family DNA binding protein